MPEPKSFKNRLHLDLDVTDRARPVVERVPVIEAKVAELVAAGASVVRRHPEDLGPDTVDGHVAVTMADPEGNEFCVS